jgi:hypothetical protein
MHPSLDWHSLGAQLRAVSPPRIALAVLCTHAGITLRAWRWKSLMPADESQVQATNLIAPQFTGFAAVALFGRLADLTRPVLIARKTGTPVCAQIAVYTLERMFDLASAAIIFSVTLAFAPRGMAHHEAFARAGVISIAATVLLAVAAFLVFRFGHRVAALLERSLTGVSSTFASRLAARVLDLQSGFATLQGFAALAKSLLLSLAIWLLIALVYVETLHAFAATPQLAGVTWTMSMLLLATSLGGSLVQLPGLGWFTQIAVMAAAMTAIYGAPLPTATACATLLLVNTTLCIVPAGLIAARLSGTSLRAVSQSGAASRSAASTPQS